MMFDLILYFSLTLLVVTVWLGFCNQRTASQRMARLNDMPMGAGFYEGMSSFQKVSYDRHLWYLFTLRNPNRLYERSSE